MVILCVRVYGADGAVRHHPHRKHDLRSGSQDHHPSKNSVQKTICCNSTSNAPDDWRMYPKHVELRTHQQNYHVASSCRFKLFHEEHAPSNNLQIYLHFSVSFSRQTTIQFLTNTNRMILVTETIVRFL